MTEQHLTPINNLLLNFSLSTQRRYPRKRIYELNLRDYCHMMIGEVCQIGTHYPLSASLLNFSSISSLIFSMVILFMDCLKLTDSVIFM